VPPDWIFVVFALLTARWWWALGAALLEDVRAASDEVFVEPTVDSPFGPARPLPVGSHSRVPLNRVLAFRGVARRVAARGRWEAGFGRRGL